MVNSIEKRIASMSSSSLEITNNGYNHDYHAQDSGDLPNYDSQSVLW
jgi:stress-induced morphogen